MVKSRILRAVLVIAGLLVLVLLVRHIGTSTIVDMLRRVGWGFGIVTALYAVHTALRGVALWQTIGDTTIATATDLHGSPRIGRPLSLGKVIRIRFGTEGVEMLTMTGPFVAEPAKGWLLHQSGIDTARAFGAVVTEYLLYNLTAAWMAAVSLSLLLWRNELPLGLKAPAEAVLVGIALVTAGFAAASVTGSGLIAPTLRGVLRIVAPRHVAAVLSRVVPIEAILVSFLHDKPSRLAAVVAVETASHALLALEIWVVLVFLGFDIGWTIPVIVEGAVKFIGAVFFFVPGQLGVSESLYSVLMASMGLPAAGGVTMALVRRARALAIGAIGFALLVSKEPARG